MDKRSPIREDAAIGSVTTASLFELIWNSNYIFVDILYNRKKLPSIYST